VPAPDMNTNEQTMAWIMDTYSMHARHTVTAVVTGKPIALGGSLGRREATGRGVLFCVNEAIKRFNLTPQDTTVVVQGSGNVGGIGAELMYNEGYKVIAISDVGGGIYNKDGLDIPDVLAYLRENKSLEGYPNVEFVDNKQLLEIECDVLAPCATENQITSENADRIKCKILAEGANGPTTPKADKILHDKGIFVIPDILANAGGVTVSYFEWVQDRMGYFWSEDEVNSRLRTKWSPASTNCAIMPRNTTSIRVPRPICWRSTVLLTIHECAAYMHSLRAMPHFKNTCFCFWSKVSSKAGKIGFVLGQIDFSGLFSYKFCS
jgi:glutamate dehydrogenase (NAD(P)+)